MSSLERGVVAKLFVAQKRRARTKAKKGRILCRRSADASSTKPSRKGATVGNGQRKGVHVNNAFHPREKVDNNRRESDQKGMRTLEEAYFKGGG